MQGVAVVRFTPRAVAVGPGDVRRARCWSTGCASPRSGSARTSCSATTAPATSRCCARSAQRYGFRAEKIDPVRYKDFVVSSTRDPAAGGRGPRGRGRRRCSATTTSSTATVVRGRPARARRSGSRRRTCAPRTSCCRRTASTPRPRRVDGVVHAVGHQHRRRGRRSATRPRRRSRRTCFDFDRDLYGARVRLGVRAAAAGRAARSPTSTRCARRSTPTAAGRGGCSTAFRCRIARCDARRRLRRSRCRLG